MELLELAFKALLLAGPPLGALIGIHKSKAFWPLAFFTFVGATITVINLRIAAQLSALQHQQSSSPPHSESIYHLASWVLGIAIISFGLLKIQRTRNSQALAELLREEE